MAREERARDEERSAASTVVGWGGVWPQCGGGAEAVLFGGRQDSTRERSERPEEWGEAPDDGF